MFIVKMTAWNIYLYKKVSIKIYSGQEKSQQHNYKRQSKSIKHNQLDLLRANIYPN